MSLTSLAILFSGIVIGLLLGLTGGGGSILTVPLLVYIVGLEAKVAIATSLVIVGLASLAALVPHSRRGNVVWKIGLLFGAAGMAGAYSGGRLAEYFSDVVLLLIFAGVMIGCGSAMVRRRGPAAETSGANAGSCERSTVRILLDGFVVGGVTGIVGAGGGFLVVPALVLLGGLPMHTAVGTSLFVISLKCFAALAGYISHAPIDLHSAVIVSALAMIGTVLGSRLSQKISGDQLQFGFGIFVLCVAAMLIVAEGSALIAMSFDVTRTHAAMGLGVVAILAALVLVMKIINARTQVGVSS